MLRMLVVDDESDICDFVKSFFKERNFYVDIAHDGKQAVDYVKTHLPDIVLLDIKMPIMSGIDALKIIKNINENIKVIMVTALADTDLAKEAKNHGANEYITKPLLLEQLEKTVLSLAKEINMSSI